jgi:hypothetical protein
MAIVQGVVSQANNPNQWGKFAINVDGNWYSTKPEWIAVKPVAGDEVTFDDGGKKYIKGLSIVGKSATAPAPAAKKGYSNLGVELGHASNVAKDMANVYWDQALVGSDDWYKYWMEHTQKVYEVMKKLREKYETPPEPKAPPEPEVVVLTAGSTQDEGVPMPAPSTDDDILKDLF